MQPGSAGLLLGALSIEHDGLELTDSVGMGKRSIPFIFKKIATI